MLDNKKDDIFLSRWINGELSPEELEEFQSHPEYEDYMKIKLGADSLDLSEYDIDVALSTMKSKQNATTYKKNTNPVIKLWPYAVVAASIAIILGLFLFPGNDSFTTSFGEQLAITLPDGSEMILNAKSEASFDKKNWETNRTIKLQGEAYFKVTKGSKFTVTTANGEVSVLGTQFNVQSNASLFEAVCYEGKVQVISDQETAMLTAGKGFRNIASKTPEHWTFTKQAPSWISNTSSFRSIPLRYVFKELEEQYDIRVDAKNIDTSIIYTGTFPNNDKDVALKTVFSTLGLQYQLSKDGKTVAVLEN